MRSALNGATLKVVSGIATPVKVTRIELRGLGLKNLEAEALHIPNQNHRPQVRVLRCGLFDTCVPDLQNLIAGFLDVCKGVIVLERENRGIATRNQTHISGCNWIPRANSFGRPCSISQSNVGNTDRASEMRTVNGGGKNISPIISGQVVPADRARVNDIAGDRLNNRVRYLPQRVRCRAAPPTA